MAALGSHHGLPPPPPPPNQKLPDEQAVAEQTKFPRASSCAKSSLPTAIINKISSLVSDANLALHKATLFRAANALTGTVSDIVTSSLGISP